MKMINIEFAWTLKIFQVVSYLFTFWHKRKQKIDTNFQIFEAGEPTIEGEELYEYEVAKNGFWPLN